MTSDAFRRWLAGGIIGALRGATFPAVAPGSKRITAATAIAVLRPSPALPLRLLFEAHTSRRTLAVV